MRVGLLVTVRDGVEVSQVRSLAEHALRDMGLDEAEVIVTFPADQPGHGSAGVDQDDAVPRLGCGGRA